MGNNIYKVYLIEIEQNWGQRLYNTKEFLSKEEAERFIKEYNRNNNIPSSSRYHMYAELAGEQDDY